LQGERDLRLAELPGGGRELRGLGGVHVAEGPLLLLVGPDGAAARMGLKRTTLISRMKKLGIDARQIV